MRAHAETGAGCCWAVSMPTSVLVRIEAAGVMELSPPPPVVLHVVELSEAVRAPHDDAEHAAAVE